MFEYRVKCRHKLGWNEIKLYADTDIEEFFNRNGIDYVRNMTDTVEHRQLKEIERLKEEIKGYEQERERVLNIIEERNHKAIEYIENEIPCLWEIDKEWEDQEDNYHHTYKEYSVDILLDILKGEDEE